MKRSILVKLELVELYAKLIDVRIVLGGGLLSLLCELIVVKMEKEVSDSAEQFDVLIRVIVSERLAIVFISEDADETETIDPPLLDTFTLLCHVNAFQHPG